MSESSIFDILPQKLKFALNKGFVLLCRIPYQSTKTYGHELGLSCAFRQWRATSHCRLIHGYALSFKLVF